MLKRKIIVFGKPIPFVLVFTLCFALVAAAALWILMQLTLAGSIVSLDSPPTAVDTFTNDDGFADAGGFDDDDDGTDPSGVFVPGLAPRSSFTLQTCTSTLTAGVVDILLDSTYDGAFCSIKVLVQNDTGNDIAVESVAVVGAPIFADLNAIQPCGWTILDGDPGSILIDVWPDPGAGAAVFSGATLDVSWVISGTETCP